MEYMKGNRMEQFSRDVKKRNDCVIRISAHEMAGYKFIEIRQYYRDNHDEFQPSKKGFTFSDKLLDDVIDAMLDLKRFMVQRMK